MLEKNKMLDELVELRQTLKNEYNDDFVCTDQALVEMVRKNPRKKNDFLAISGINDTFIKKYANHFLKVINKYRLANTKEVKVSRKAFKVLNNYKDRLTNISKNNPNLYLGQIQNVRSFDLASLNDNQTLIEYLTNNRIKNYEFKINEDNFKKLTTLYRNTNKDQKETGSYNLYIAYPYIEGYIKREKFAIKAPLLLFPVILKRNRKNFTLVKDDNKEIIYNRDLLLMISKLDNESIKDSDLEINDFNFKTVKEKVLPFYKNNGVNISGDFKDFEFEKFQSQLKDDFVKNKFKDFELKQYLTLVRYKPYSSMIQKDMDTIIANSKYNELLEGLIDESNLEKPEKEVIYTTDSKNINEDDITYINQLNDAQEKVIDLLNKEKKLVIFGPPGTGKSQTITSIIANAVLKGENVLVVSEKKVALDVICSRLKNASKYAMFIDDAEDKTKFYETLSNYLDPTPPIRTVNNDLFQSEAEIIKIINTLNRSLKLLFKEEDEVLINEIFNRYIQTNKIIDNLIPKRVYEMFNNNFKDISFKTIKHLEKTFNTNIKLKDYLTYYKMINNYSIIKKIETKLTRSSVIEFKAFGDSFKTFLDDYETRGRFKKRRLKKRFLKNNKGNLDYLTNSLRLEKKYLNLIIKDQTLNNYLLENINKLNKISNNYNKLSKDAINFLKMLNNDSLLKDLINIEKYRTYLFDAYYTGYLEVFKANNQKDLYIIEEYEGAILKLNELINEKITISNESFEMELYLSSLNLANSKRIMDIRRILEQTKKPSINEFINYFQPELLQNIKIWMMTPEVVSAVVPLDYGMFDLVIFDEASQMYVEKGIPAIYRSKKVVIAGDPKQLRPSSLGFGRLTEDDTLYEDEMLVDVSIDAKSLLDLARYKYPETLLNYHYRSNYEELIAFSNYAFYDAKLIVSPNQKASLKPPIEYVYVKDATFKNRANEKEAAAVVDLIKKILRTRKNNETIGVITFNSSQRDLIENYIDQELFKKSQYQKLFENEINRFEDNEDKSLFVKNIENVQGDERDIIIFSMGYAKDKSGVLMRRFGWLNHEGGQNRLNVAITRAKDKIYFVTSLYPEEFKVDDLKGSGPKLLKDFMRYCYYISNNNNELAKVVLNELHQTESETKKAITNKLVKDVRVRLERLKYNVKTSIGIGDYHINLAIYDENDKSYKLGIICDINNESNINSRQTLLHQERYLQARGWKIYRIFSHNWYNDANHELRNIRRILK